MALAGPTVHGPEDELECSVVSCSKVHSMEPWSIEDDLTTDEWQLTDLTSVSTWERVITDLDVLIEDRMKEAKIRIRNHLYTWQDLSR